MKNSFKTIITVLGLGLFVTACEPVENIIPSTNVSTQERVVNSYHGIQIEATFQADVRYSTTEESIVIEANENLHQYIEVEYTNGILKVGFRNRTNIKGPATLKAHITTNNLLSSYSASGASIITLEDVMSANKVNIDISGASSFDGDIITTTLDLSMSGASNATITGEVGNLYAHLSGASVLDSFGMITKDADLDFSGASSANLTINGTIDFTGSGASVLVYRGTGSPNSINLSDGSQIIKN